MTRRKPVDVEGRYRAAYNHPGGRDANVQPPDAPRWALIVFWIALVALLGLVAKSAFGHEEFRCSSASYRNINGMDCCSAKTDCVPIKNEVAFEARIGLPVEATFPSSLFSPSEIRSVTVNAIHPSCDDHGWSWICKTGCLFRAAGF